MRLTSYNMAVKALNAKGCFANMVDRMWGYMEEGDTANADCVRQKALMLLGLIKTIERWRPTITSGKTVTYVATIDSGTFTFPYSSNVILINGIPILSRSYVYGDDNADVLRVIVNSINRFLSGDNDILQGVASTFDNTISTTFKYSDELSPLTPSVEFFSQGVTVSYVVSEEIDFTATYGCLTNEQILSVIGKIDELCDCNC